MLKIANFMISILLLCLLVAGCGKKGSRESWERIDLGTDAEFRDIFFLDDQNGWIVGAAGINVPGGIIGRTHDGGLTWEYRSGLIGKRSGSHSVDLNAVHFTTLQRGIIAAESGVILLTEDGGESWKKAPFSAAVYAHHQDLDFVDELNGWIIGRKGVLRTEDGGGTWQQVNEDKEVLGNAIDFLNLENGWVVGKFGKVYHTLDGGITWEVVPALGNLDGLKGDDIPTLTSVHFVDENQGWIAGYLRQMTLMEQHDRAVILHTSDGGLTWTHQVQEVEALLTAVRFADPLRGWATGFNRNDGTSVILNTTDGGDTWQLQTTIFGEELLALAISGDQVWAVGDRVRNQPQQLLRLVPADPVP